MVWARHTGNNLKEMLNKYMSTTISKNLKKTSIKVDRWGNILEHHQAESKQDEMKRKQIERAKKLGMI
jgi:hypothetical protein